MPYIDHLGGAWLANTPNILKNSQIWAKKCTNRNWNYVTSIRLRSSDENLLYNFKQTLNSTYITAQKKEKWAHSCLRIRYKLLQKFSLIYEKLVLALLVGHINAIFE